jgi:glycosyltransferase involved in cell wall biosynthesis
MKRIGIDARFLGTETGIGRYVEELVKHLEQIAKLRQEDILRTDAENQFFIFLTEKNWDKYNPCALNFYKIKADFRWYSWQEQIFFPFLIKKYKIDLMHFPHFNVPLFCPAPFVVTIHDLILLHYPSTRASTLGPFRFYLKYVFYRLILKHAITNSKVIFVPSKFTKNDILNHFSVPENKIIVTYEANSLDNVKPAKKEFLKALKITKPYFLTVGNAYPHKNLKRLFSVFKKFNLEQNKKFQLVFVGPNDYFYNQFKIFVNELGFKEDEVIMPGKVNDEELKLLYLNAFAYVFPSLYEGFGLPGLEAMSCGVPVVAADCTSLPEIYGNAAFYFNPTSDDEMFNALVRISEDKKLRNKLKENGFEIIKQYSWEKLSEKTLQNYKNL